ncbi:MAG: hypothetical protein D3915_13135 [Candidatus Electrothrix sp. AU1_5]|nr:hypothetical protein [Candidatus Electrothrix gigas]
MYYTANHKAHADLAIQMKSSLSEELAVPAAACACVRAFWQHEPFSVWESSILVEREDGRLWQVVFDDNKMNNIQFMEQHFEESDVVVSVPQRLIDHAYRFCNGGPDPSLTEEL